MAKGDPLEKHDYPACLNNQQLRYIPMEGIKGAF